MRSSRRAGMTPHSLEFVSPRMDEIGRLVAGVMAQSSRVGDLAPPGFPWHVHFGAGH